MNLVENYGLMDGKHPGMTITKTETSENFNTPKISSSVSFSNLAKVKIRHRTKSPQIQDRSYDYSGSTNPSTQQLTSKFKQAANAPKVSKKLPPAFGTIFQRSAAKIAKNPSFDHSKEASEPLQVLDQLVGMQEYKNTMGLLSPLKPINVKNQIEEPVPQKIIPKKPEGKRHKNPLLPLKNYLLLSKLTEERKEGNLSLDRLDKLYKMTKETLINKKDSPSPKSIKPNEMITLSVIKSSHESGTVKKVLHAPTLRLFAVKEVPLSTREIRNNLKDWLAQWRSNFENNKSLINIHATTFNSPEGCLSIYMELMNAGSLQNLLESMGNLPEAIIKVLATQLLTALDSIHTRTNTVYGALSPSQILFDRDGNIKLSLGLSNKIQSSASSASVSNKNTEKAALYELTPINHPGSFQRHLVMNKDNNSTPENKHLLFSQDVFEFGYLMLLCAVGGIDFYESHEFADKLKIFFEELAKKPQERQKYCCIIHNEELIASIKNPEDNYFSNKPVRVQKGNPLIIEKNSKQNAVISIQDFLLTNNFSNDFVKFLCCCLKFDPNERSSIRALMNSPFIQNKEARGPSVALPDLLKISAQWSKNVVLPLEYQGPSERQLHKLCEALAVVLPNCEAITRGPNAAKIYEQLKNISVNSPVIQNLSYELGLPAQRVWTEINSTINSLAEAE